jgi:hypothetical protein
LRLPRLARAEATYQRITAEHFSPGVFYGVVATPLLVLMVGIRRRRRQG